MKKIISIGMACLIACVILMSPSKVRAEGETPIYTYEDLELIRENPSGSYTLMNDIDCTGQTWTPVDFTGYFDGRGHALLNLSITDVSQSVRTTYDGNMKTYDTCFAGFFGCLENALVRDLTLAGVNVDINIERDCFAGGLAGYTDGATIDNCKLEGTVSLHVKGAMFGVGGIVGFGNGTITNTTADMTLINVDLDASTRDEEFLGGAYGAGYIDLDNDDINLKGYVSDHGYVHSGGMVGMYALYPAGYEYAGYITNVRVSQDSKIFFFEDNTNRRAYCDPVNGEVLNWTYAFSGCSAPSKDVFRNETMDYSKDLYPHGDCSNTDFTEETVEGSCESFGYTLHTCSVCGYSYKDSFTLKPHNLSGEVITYEEATTEKEGLECQVCATCGESVYTRTEKIVPTPTPTPEIEKETPAETEDKSGEGGSVLTTVLLALLILVAVAITAFAFITLFKPKKGRRK